MSEVAALEYSKETRGNVPGTANASWLRRATGNTVAATVSQENPPTAAEFIEPIQGRKADNKPSTRQLWRQIVPQNPFAFRNISQAIQTNLKLPTPGIIRAIYITNININRPLGIALQECRRSGGRLLAATRQPGKELRGYVIIRPTQGDLAEWTSPRMSQNWATVSWVSGSHEEADDMPSLQDDFRVFAKCNGSEKQMRKRCSQVPHGFFWSHYKPKKWEAVYAAIAARIPGTPQFFTYTLCERDDRGFAQTAAVRANEQIIGYFLVRRDESWSKTVVENIRPKRT